MQGVSQSQQLRDKHGFPNLANSRTSPLFPKYFIE